MEFSELCAEENASEIMIFMSLKENAIAIMQFLL